MPNVRGPEMMETLERAVEAVRNTVGVAPETWSHALWTILLILLYFAVKRIATGLINRHVQDVTKRYIAAKTTTYLLGIVSILIIFRVWYGGSSGLLTYLGILSAGLAIALQDPLVNLAGWLFIMVRRPFTLGDRIHIGDAAGDVVDIRLFQFSLVEIGEWVDADQSTGRILHIPNGWVFKNAIANFTTGFNFIWNEIPVTVTFESDWRKAKDILQRIAEENNAFDSQQAKQQMKRVSQKYLIFYTHLTPIVWTKVIDIGVTLTIRYLCEPRKRRSSETAIWESVLGEFAKTADIDFAYPTQRFYFNPSEGKPETGGPAKED